jgi:sirohydrochlorin ferrochelatase
MAAAGSARAAAWGQSNALAPLPAPQATATPLLLVVHGRSGGMLPPELEEMVVDLEQRRGAPVRLQALTAVEPPPPAELLRLGRGLILVPLLLLPGGHVRHDLPAIVRHWRGQVRLQHRPFLGAWPSWQRGLRQELQRLGATPLLLHHPVEGLLAARYLAHLERSCGARCLATPYSSEHLADLQLPPAVPALPLALAANRLTDQLADRVGPPLLHRPALRQLLVTELEALP